MTVSIFYDEKTLFLKSDWQSNYVSVHFLCLPKENEPKEKALSRQVFFKDRLKKSLFKNHISKAKFSPRLQKFLTLLKYYTYDKGFVI